MPSSVTIRTVNELLEASAATPAFKEAVQALATNRPQEQIQFNAGAPPVKQLRFILKLLEVCPDHPLESVTGQAVSGCSHFSGLAEATPGPLKLDFHWDCRWQAQQQGWLDAFGDPDQIRAARECGYQCFEKFNVTR